MNNAKSLLFLFGVLFFALACTAQPAPDTVKAGVYVTSIHDIDFKQKEYAVSLWLWLK